MTQIKHSSESEEKGESSGWGGRKGHAELGQALHMVRIHLTEETQENLQ